MKGREGTGTFLWDHPDENQSKHGQRNQWFLAVAPSVLISSFEKV